MNISQSCLDCFWCKVIYALGILRCRAEGNHWHSLIVELTKEEVRTGEIEPRDIFKKALKCKDFDPMPIWF